MTYSCRICCGEGELQGAAVNCGILMSSLSAAIVLHNHSIAEMKTGEGKTLVATLPAYLNALTGKGVHVVTVNDYLARRDAVWMGQVYAALGLSVGVINHDSSYLYDLGHKEVDEKRDEEGSFKVFYEFLRPCDTARSIRGGYHLRDKLGIWI